ncbi:MAG: MATE family efflux transporter, partial [Lachnospiraceae bacterium]|nr:MATE family efflux transporter [Lachnospiraceae bacterium]
LNLMAQSINHTVLDGIFAAGGDTKYDMTTNIYTMWCYSLPCALIAAFVLHLPAPVVYCIANSDEIVKLPAVIRRYRKYLWLKNITRDAQE